MRLHREQRQGARVFEDESAPKLECFEGSGVILADPDAPSKVSVAFLADKPHVMRLVLTGMVTPMIELGTRAEIAGFIEKGHVVAAWAPVSEPQAHRYDELIARALTRLEAPRGEREDKPTKLGEVVTDSLLKVFSHPT